MKSPLGPTAIALRIGCVLTLAACVTTEEPTDCPRASLDVDQVVFDDLVLGEAATAYITISNACAFGVDLGVSGLQIAGDPAISALDEPFSLAAGEGHEVQVTATVTSYALAQATLTWTTSDGELTVPVRALAHADQDGDG